ncbi:hypothetical protein LBMAG27_04510 [Bacteroidota bacterium]|nr:hypothetical protein LBMAG27_04510 [Bacteroidota bacterium]
MKKNKSIIQSFTLLIAVAILFSSCEKNISIDVPAPPDKLVVEGFIETGSFPYVILTKNSAYYSTFNLTDINKYFVHDAVVKVSDGTDTVTLQEIIYDTAGVQISVYFGFGLLGQVGKTYSLHIEAEGKTVDAVTTILPSIPLDSIWVTYNENPDFPDKVRLYCQLSDPAQLGQYVRYFTKVDTEVFEPGLNSVFDDVLINGTTFKFPLDRGYNRNDSIDFDSYGLFNKGDTITVKWCNIEKAHFDFWRTLEFSLGSQGNPFSSPLEIKSNIVGGLGIWGGYSPSFKTIIVPQ